MRRKTCHHGTKGREEGIVETLKKCPYSADAAIIGEVIAEEPGRVIMETEIGTQALLPQPGGRAFTKNLLTGGVRTWKPEWQLFQLL